MHTNEQIQVPVVIDLHCAKSGIPKSEDVLRHENTTNEKFR